MIRSTHKSNKEKMHRAFAVFLSTLVLATTTPPVFAEVPVSLHSGRTAARPIPPAPQPKGGVRHASSNSTASEAKFNLSDDPTDLELTTCVAFQEPLVPLSGQVIPGENARLAAAIKGFKAKDDLEDLAALTDFINSNPKSRWTPSVEATVGSLKYGTGYISDALTLWASAWNGAKAEKGRGQSAMASGAFANLVNLSARLGRREELQNYLKEVTNRPFFGSDERKVKGARDGLQYMERRPAKAYLCGPGAVFSLLTLSKKKTDKIGILRNATSTSEGTSLAQVDDLASQVGLNYKMAKRTKGAAFITPAIAHFKVNHFAALIGEDSGRYHIQDPTFDSDSQTWASAKALEAETDGYFLIPASESLPSGWQAVSEEEAKSVKGKGTSTGHPAPPGQCMGDDCCPAGMAHASALTPQATLNIKDMPLHYSCPIGPPMNFSVNYNFLEGGQPSGSVFSFSNLGPNWSTNWVSYLTVSGSTATVRLRSGGIETDVLSGGTAPNNHFSHAVLAGSGTSYTRTLPDGTVETFNVHDTATPPHIFMSSVTSPQGQVTTINFAPTTFRVTGVTDPLGQISTFSYFSNTVGSTGYYNITGISDPFGRTCTFTYDSATTTNLLSITDQIGLVSSFAYDTSSSMINQMSTAYGTTAFYQYVPSPPVTYPPQGLKITYPDGTYEVVENWLDEVKSTFYWDRHATQLYPNEPGHPGDTTTFSNYTHCEILKYCVDSLGGPEGTSLQTVTHPLEALSPISYQHPGQTNGPDFSGTSDLPSQVSRSLGNQDVDVTVGLVSGGSITPGDKITVGIVSSSQYTYTVQSSDTSLSIIAANIANAINSGAHDTGFSPLTADGVTSGVAGPIFTLHSDKQNKYQYFASCSNSLGTGSGQETVTRLSHVKQTVSGTMTGAIGVGDKITISVDTPWPNEGGTQPCYYVVQTGDTLASIVNQLANNMTTGVNHNSILQAFGVNATVSGATISLVSYNPEVQGWHFSNDEAGGGHEFIDLTQNIYNGAKEFENYTYTGYGNLSQSIDSIGRTFTYNYAINGIDLNQKLENKGTDNFQLGAWTYNSNHCPLVYTDGSGRQTTNTYNYLNQLATVVDAASNTTTLTYTATDTATVGGTISNNHIQTLTVTNSGLTGGHEAVTFTEHTGDTTTTIATGLAAAVNADVHLQAIGVSATSSGPVITLISTSPNVTTYSRTVTGTITITFASISRGYLTKIDGPLAGSQDITTFSYDGFGRLYTATDSEGYTKVFTYDAMDRQIQTAYPDGSTEQTVWNKLDAVMMKDRIGRWSQKSFDSMDELTYAIDPLGRKTQYVWCSCGSLLTLTDPANHVTSWQHDLQGRTTQKSLQDSTTTNYVYESWSSRLLSMTDALNQTKTFFYNPDNTPYQSNYTNAVNATAPVTFLWDSNFKRMTSAHKNDWGATAATGTISYTYNPYFIPLGTVTTGGGMLQLVHNDVIANSDTSYTYDVLGRTTNRSINSTSNSDTWTFDAMSRVTAETNALGSWTYAYVDDTSGSSKGTTRLASITYPNSQVTNYGWYPTVNDERLQQIANLKSSGGATISQYGQLYDSVGQITQWQQLQNNSSLNYCLGYDSAGQLTSSQAASGGPSTAYLKQNYYNYDLASNRTGSQQSSVTRVKVGGTGTTGDTVTITVHNAGLSGGQEAITYNGNTGDSSSVIASSLNASIMADSNLQAIGVNASTNGSVISIKAASPFVTTISSTTSGGATETISANVTGNFVENAVVGGTKTTGNTVTITVSDPALSGGHTAITYTVLAADTLTTIATGVKTAINANTSLSTLGVTATSVGTTITINSTSSNATTYSQSTSAGATEIISLSINQNGPQTIALGGTKTTSDTITATVYDVALTGGLEAVTYTVLAGDTLTSIATGLAAAINADTHLQGVAISATSSGPVITVQSNSINPMTLRGTTSATATENVSLNIPANGFQTAVIGGTKTTGDTLTFTTFDAGLVTGSEAVAYTVLAGDTLTSIATGLVAAINADANLSAIGVTASAASTVVNVKSTSINSTTYTEATSGGATETITLAPATSGTLYGYNNVNELTSIGAGGPILFQATTNKALSSATVNSAAVTLNWGESFSGYASLSSGTNTVPVSATDGASHVKTNNYQVSVNGPSSSTPVYDVNGNMTSDGTNSYVWDAENRLVQITYPGSGNNSQFIYDPFSGLVKIVEAAGGSVTSTKQFVRCGSQICEERDSSSTLTKQFFGWGQRNIVSGVGTNCFYTRDHLGSVRDMVDSTGTVQAHYEYRMFGEVTQTVGTLSADFGYVGYYFHAPSGLNLTTYRAYSPSLGRWINRDPIQEEGGVNLYAYVRNMPITSRDPSGLQIFLGNLGPPSPSDDGGGLVGAAAGAAATAAAAAGGLGGGLSAAAAAAVAAAGGLGGPIGPAPIGPTGASGNPPAGGPPGNGPSGPKGPEGPRENPPNDLSKCCKKRCDKLLDGPGPAWYAYGLWRTCLELCNFKFQSGPWGSFPTPNPPVPPQLYVPK